MTALQGINLGGWLIAEQWMTPDLFRDVTRHGERALGRELGVEVAHGRLETHRKTFITEKDFAWIKHAGFDTVRLPVGYWLFEGDEGFVTGETYVDKTFRWAHRHSLGVILDFHGLPGSQNGHDHSGEVGKVRLYKKDNRRRALVMMEYLARRYGQEPALLAIEVINEPKVRWFLGRLLKYYDEAFAIVQRFVRPDVKIIVSDAFKPLRMAKALSRRDYGDQLVLDVHLYQVFSRRDQELSFDEHVDKVRHEWQPLLEKLTSYVPAVLAGEWSAALPVHAYDGLVGGEAGNAGTYYKAQKELFDELTWGHCYWSYKAPGCGVWDFRELQDNL